MHVLNGLKYFSTIVAVVMRTGHDLKWGVTWKIMAAISSGVATVASTYWDIVIDWGLLRRNSRNPWLRDKLLIPHKSVYFVAIVSTLRVGASYNLITTLFLFLSLSLSLSLFLSSPLSISQCIYYLLIFIVQILDKLHFWSCSFILLLFLSLQFQLQYIQSQDSYVHNYCHLDRKPRFVHRRTSFYKLEGMMRIDKNSFLSFLDYGEPNVLQKFLYKTRAI